MLGVGEVLFSDVIGLLLVMLFGVGLLADGGGGGVIAVLVFCSVGGRFGFELLKGSVLIGREVVVVLVDGLDSVMFDCVGGGIVLLVGPAPLGRVMFVKLTGLPFKSPGSEVGSPNSGGCVGFWFVVFVVMEESVLGNFFKYLISRGFNPFAIYTKKYRFTPSIVSLKNPKVPSNITRNSCRSIMLIMVLPSFAAR